MTDALFARTRLTDERAALEATFIPAAGMLCCSLRHRGEELLAQNAGVDVYAQRGKTMGIPLLYPWANRLAGFEYSVAGRTVKVPHDPSRIALDNNGLPIHGVIGGRLEWELTSSPGSDSSPGIDGRSLAARLSWSESEPELFEVFPFHHDLHYEASLTDGQLQIGVSVHACGEDVVPVAFGFHPYLSPPGVPRERWLIELPAMRHLTLDSNQIPIGPDPADTKHASAQRFELGKREFDDGFESVAGQARFAVTAGARRIELELLEDYPCAQVYAPLSGPFVCFEPMTAPANALRSGVGLRMLNPGERCSARFSIRVSDLVPQ
jgi:aldose 1-epimerase